MDEPLLRLFPARCKFHYEFSRNPSSSISSESPSVYDVVCSLASSKPTWVDKRTMKPLPACQFSPRFCKEESLLVLHNAKSLFRPGNLPTNGTAVQVHSAIITCNEDGFFLAKNDAPLANKNKVGICSNRHMLSCREGVSFTKHFVLQLVQKARPF